MTARSRGRQCQVEGCGASRRVMVLFPGNGWNPSFAELGAEAVPGLDRAR